jgi:hypothetical protein
MIEPYAYCELEPTLLIASLRLTVTLLNVFFFKTLQKMQAISALAWVKLFHVKSHDICDNLRVSCSG